MTGVSAVPASAQRQSFDLCGPLPTGTTVLEASAGTGKTFAIGALVTRFVAEGAASLPDLLIVTFGRAASQELRERVRGALVAAERALADPVAARAGADPVLALLAHASPDEVVLRRRRLSTALADFDAATIATTHQFCQQVLTGLGVAGDSDSGVVLVENLDDLVVEVVEDLWIRKYGRAGGEEPQFTFDQAVAIGRAAVGDPATRLEPRDAPDGSVAATRLRFAAAVRETLEQRKRALAVLGYDDLLSRLRAVLEQPHSAALDRMREQWKVVLVDEFQDTDPVQWDVIRLAFGGQATVVLVGDPKQAIYGFRGGDIVTYLTAASTAQHQFTLDRNYRSDAPLVDALQVLFDGAALGDDRIPVRPIQAVQAGSRLAGLPHPSPIRLRRVDRSWFDAGSGKAPSVNDVRPVVASDLAADIDQLLGSDATFDGKPLKPEHVAVLVAQHARANEVRDALQRRGIPAVLAVGHGSVFETTAAADWLALLRALDQPHRSNLVRAAALTPLVGATAEEIDTGADAATDRYATLLHSWADALRQRGVAGVLELAGERGLAARELRQVGGERQLTDLRHVAEALHAAAVVRPVRAARDDRVATTPDHRRRDRHRHRTAAPAGQRRRGGTDRYPAFEQGPAVPDRLPAVRLRGAVRRRPQRARQDLHPARRRPAGAGRPRRGCPWLRRAAHPGPGRGGGRTAAAALRVADQGAEPGRAVVGAVHADHRFRVAAAALRPGRITGRAGHARPAAGGHRHPPVPGAGRPRRASRSSGRARGCRLRSPGPTLGRVPTCASAG